MAEHRGLIPSRQSAEVAADEISRAINACRRALDMGERATAARWLDRVCRLKPRDPVSRLRIVMLALHLPEAPAEAQLREMIADYPDFREPQLGLASLLLRRGEAEAAGKMLAALLGRIAPGPDEAFRRMASAIAAGCGAPGWVGADSSGKVTLAHRWPWGKGRFVLRLDGAPIPLDWDAEAPPPLLSAQLPARWTECRLLAASHNGCSLLGSPIALPNLRRAEGIVETGTDGAIEGWAWLPGDPEAIPRFRVFFDSRPDAQAIVAAADEAMALPAGSGAIRPRGFRFDPAALPGRGALHVVAPDGRPLAGSPCYLSDVVIAARDAAAAIGRLFPAGTVPSRQAKRVQSLRWQAVPIDSEKLAAARRGGRKALPGRAPVSVIVPVYRGAAEFRACLRALQPRLPDWARIVVVDDATEDLALRAAVASAAVKRHVTLLRHERNRGFPSACNSGMRHALARGHDVVLLNSDTIVPAGWLEALATAAYSEADIGSVTPFSNDAAILSYPHMRAANPAPNVAETERLNKLFRRANGTAVLDICSGVGYCMFIRRDCLGEVGLFREDLFAQGYGEENDWSIRAAWYGWRHVAALGTFVGHAAGVSFGRAAVALRRRNMRVLERLHPGYGDFAAEFIRRDPLARPRRNADAERWAERSSPNGAVVLVTHDLGGGVERHVRERCAALAAEGLRPIVLRPAADAEGDFDNETCIVSESFGDEFPNLRFRLPAEIDDLARLLLPDRPLRMEVHHLLGHADLVRPLAIRLRVFYDVVIHDWSLVCPRVNLCNKTRAYCGEPARVAECVACVADAGSRLGEDIGIEAMRARSAELLAKARGVIVSCEDAAERLSRWFPAVDPIVRPWEPDPPPSGVDVVSPITAPLMPGEGRASTTSGAAPRTWMAGTSPAMTDLHEPGGVKICIVGSLTLDKGFDTLLECARDAARRGLPLQFVVVGNSFDDARLLDAGAFVTGWYEEAELPGLIAAQGAQLGFLPSAAPETWCYTLTAMFKAGLSVVAFGLGAQAERIRRTGRGFLLPLGLAPARINDALLRFAAGRRSADSQQAGALRA